MSHFGDLEVQKFIDTVLVDYRPPTLRRAVLYNGTLSEALNFCCFYYFTLQKIGEHSTSIIRTKIIDYLLEESRNSSLASGYKRSIAKTIEGIRRDEQNEIYNNLNPNDIPESIVDEWIEDVVANYQPDFSGQLYCGKLHDPTFRYGAVSYYSFYVVAVARLRLLRQEPLKRLIAAKLSQLANGKNHLGDYKSQVFELINSIENPARSF
eukprot:TRINITY_DN3713_c0_g1_i1.p1 TRINITY_DN3713_c0_g1~~TRINITY_DN3713_c0_g1_i1.p1  ORF type:complete len:209 (+),score=111.39 TRINITY_DN3713_c0_g1_i1:52-678(+)